MLNIYYARESIDKDRFIYEHIKPGSIVIVPDQFSLQAERDALFYMQKDALMDIEILSFSRLRDRVFQETGGAEVKMIDKQGRHMMLARIMRHLADDLKIYGRYKQKAEFLDMMNDMISELKQYDITPEALSEMADETAGPLLARKLDEIGKVYEAYEDAIEGHYIDTEDLAELFVRKIPESSLIRESEIWIYGFDVFSPKNLKAIGEMIGASKGVSVALTYDDDPADADLFRACRQTLEKLEDLAMERNIKPQEIRIGSEYARKQSSLTKHIEKNIYALPFSTAKEADGLTLVKADDAAAEAETAAAYVSHLVRDKGYRYSDIMIIANDIAKRGPLCRRVFARHGIRLFVDEKRGILHTPPAAFAIALGDIIADSYRTDDVIRLIRTGLTDLGRRQADRLENYAKKYGIRGQLWKQPFEKGLAAYSEEEAAELEASRAAVIDPIASFHEEYKSTRDVGGKVRILYKFFEECGLPSRIEALMDRQEEAGDREAAEETAQVWDRIVGILEQLAEIMGDETIRAADLAVMIRAGIEAVEIGVLPPSSDGLMMGTMQRTRGQRVKALIVMGANEGVLPMDPVSSGILTDEEKERIAKKKEIQISKPDSLRAAEESLAIYRNLSRPEEELYVSCAAADDEGKVSRPSHIFSKLEEMFPGAAVRPDVYACGDPMELVDAASSTVLAAAGAANGDGANEAVWKEVFAWLTRTDPETAAGMRRAMEYDGGQKKIERNLIKRLYASDDGAVRVSASRLERFSRCPFSYFMKYGLKADEERKFEADSLEMGSVYHEVLMRVSRRLTGSVPVTDENSDWMTISDDDLEKMTKETVDDLVSEYSEGLFVKGKPEIYRSSRMRELCTWSAKAMVRHVRKSKIREIMCEVPFGTGKRLDPIELDTDNGKVIVEGRIDRLDISEDGYAKVIDYKSSSRDMNEAEVRGGWDLQLMLYIKVAAENGYRPAGTFYYYIHEPDLKLKESEPEPEGPEDNIKREYAMKGWFSNEPGAIRSIDGSCEGDSEVIKGMGFKKDGDLKKTDRAKSPEEFDQLMDDVADNAGALASAILDGEAAVRPKKTKSTTACEYCPYKGVCKFDTAFAEHRYEYI